MRMFKQGAMGWLSFLTFSADRLWCLPNCPSILFRAAESEIALTERQPRRVSNHDWMRFLMTA